LTQVYESLAAAKGFAVLLLRLEREREREREREKACKPSLVCLSLVFSQVVKKAVLLSLLESEQGEAQ